MVFAAETELETSSDTAPLSPEQVANAQAKNALLTLEIPVYEPLFRGSARFVEVRDFSQWETFFLVPKHIKMVQNTQIHPGKLFWRVKSVPWLRF